MAVYVNLWSHYQVRACWPWVPKTVDIEHKTEMVTGKQSYY